MTKTTKGPTKKKRRQPRQPPSDVPAEFTILEADAESDFRLLEAAGDEGEAGAAPKLRRFAMTAYTGGRLVLAEYPYPVVVDLSGLRISTKSRPILRDHHASQIVGHTEAIENTGGSLRLKGVISAANAFAREVADSSDNGFPWQASIGAAAQRIVFIDRGEPVEVNGRRFTGPLYVARQAALREVSFVALGADDQTSARMAAGTHTAGNTIKVNDMEFEQWLEARGFAGDELNAQQAESLRALWEADQREPPEPDGPPSAAPPATGAPPTITWTDGAAVRAEDDALLQDLRAKYAAETRRIEAIREACGGKHPKIEARAIEEGWERDRTELEVLRSTRPQAPAAHTGGATYNAQVLEAAACLSAGIPENELATEFGDQTLSAAYPLRYIGLKELVAECARIEGREVPRVFGDGQATIRAGFSTISLPGILENVMNKTLLASYRATPIAALQLCATGSVSDFKEVSRYRLLGTGGFEKVAASGELKAGRADELKFTNKADTYGQLLLLTRQDILNDDLNAFLEIPREMGRSGGSWSTTCSSRCCSPTRRTSSAPATATI